MPSRIIQFYIAKKATFSSDDRIRANDVDNTITDWKNKYRWYADFITDRDNSDFLAYALNDPDYKNRVANFYLLNYTIYIPVLNNYVKDANQLIKEIRAPID